MPRSLKGFARATGCDCRSLIVLLFLLMGLVIGRAAGAFRVFSQPYHIPERGPVTSYTALTESNRFNFIPPHRWSTRVDESERSVTLQPPNHAAGLVIRWLDVVTNGIPAERTNFWRELVIERHAECEIVRDFKAYTRSGKAEGFEIVRGAEIGRRVSTRVAYLPYEHGIVEFSLTTQADHLSSFHLLFGHLMGSFKAEPWVPSIEDPVVSNVGNGPPP